MIRYAQMQCLWLRRFYLDILYHQWQSECVRKTANNMCWLSSRHPFTNSANHYPRAPALYQLQVRDYLFKWTEFFRIKYVRSWVVGLPYHPQLRNYMTLSILILFTPLWFLKSGWLNKRWPYVVLILDKRRHQLPRMKYNSVVTSAFIIPRKH